jgi:HSP20 family molecular chaperone IbpA
MQPRDDFEDMRKSINRVLSEAFRDRQGAFQEPFIYGFTVRSTPDRRDVPRRVRIEKPEERPVEVCAEIVESEEELFVTMELPDQAGVAPTAMARGRKLVIHGKGSPLSLDLPDEAQAEPSHLSFRNGVVDVVLRRLRPRPTLRIG